MESKSNPADPSDLCIFFHKQSPVDPHSCKFNGKLSCTPLRNYCFVLIFLLRVPSCQEAIRPYFILIWKQSLPGKRGITELHSRFWRTKYAITLVSKAFWWHISHTVHECFRKVSSNIATDLDKKRIKRVLFKLAVFVWFVCLKPIV